MAVQIRLRPFVILRVLKRRCVNVISWFYWWNAHVIFDIEVATTCIGSHSSVGQSVWLITIRSAVQARVGALFF